MAKAWRAVYCVRWESEDGGGSFPLPSRTESGAALHAATMRRLFTWLRRSRVEVVRYATEGAKRGVVIAQWRAGNDNGTWKGGKYGVAI